METKDGVLLEMKAMDQTTQQLKKFLNPTQIAKFLLLADKVSPPKHFLIKSWLLISFLIEQDDAGIRHFPPLGDKKEPPQSPTRH